MGYAENGAGPERTAKKKKIKISVRSLVEFVFRSGDINRRFSGAEKDAMQAGSRAHRRIQRRMGTNYQAEVPMRHVVEEEDYQVIIEGRADGVVQEGGEAVIDEIKGVYFDIWRLEEPVPVHLAQALCYAYFYCCDHGLGHIGVQVTYCGLESEEVRRFREQWTAKALGEWFSRLMHEYAKWAKYLYCHGLRREESLKRLEFPYAYREGQRELAASVYRCIKRGANLFIQAPTGIGKTLSTVFPALKAMGEGEGEKLFYLTAKTITRSVAEECFALLRDRGLFFSTVTITARDKLCFLGKAECIPDVCPYAKGHFDRVNDAVFAMICAESGITREKIVDYAARYQVCPYEFCLDISSWVDGIICDYNYVFDPNVRLRRYFSDTAAGGGYILLIDEAHNLVGRAREMFSAALVKEDILAVRRILKGHAPKVVRALNRCNQNMLEYKRSCERYEVLEECSLLSANLLSLYSEMEIFLGDEREFEDRDTVLQFYFGLRHFLNMYEKLDDHYRIYTELRGDGTFFLKLFCVDPSKCLKECLDRGIGNIFFSATLLPVTYYKKLMSGNPDDYAVYASSPFPPQNRLLMVGADVSSRYTRRNPAEYQKIIGYIRALAQSHKGNYMVFFPSYHYMEEVGRLLGEGHVEAGPGWGQARDGFEWKMQSPHMTESDREEFLADFDRPRDHSFVAFCVLGGMFSEGIDLKAERLEGAVIVGTGLPLVCTEQEILKSYFEQHAENGYDYAYQYPGMNKVLQAAGRVIRTPEDKGVILLLDDRFLRNEIQALFPREWTHYAKVTRHSVAGWLRCFWDSSGGFP